VNIMLIGMRGSGKTTVGRLLATELNMTFIDLDEEITRRAGRSVTEIVEASGWDVFRDLEGEASRLVAKRDNQVVATGGGIVEREDNVRALRARGTVVWLRADAATLSARIADGEDRPPLTGSDPETEMRRVLVSREARYSAAADIQIDTVGQTPDEIVKTIIESLSPGGAK